MLALVSVNLVGYAVSATDIDHVLTRLLSLEGLYAVAGSFYFLVVGYQIMMAIEAARRGWTGKASR